MTEEQIKKDAERYASVYYHPYDSENNPQYLIVSEDSFIAGAHSRDEEIEQLRKALSSAQQAMAELAEIARNPWITDRDPEIKGSRSDAVLLLIDGMFYKVSRLERRKDGSEFWWGVDVMNGEEVDAWMPIPELKKGK